MDSTTFILGGLISVLISRTDAYKCLSCKASARPRDCESVQECGPHEKCSIESYATISGYIRYDLGCMDIYKCAAFGSKRAVLNATVLEEIKEKDTFAVVPDEQWDDSRDSLLCTECCTKDLCNAQGCGEAGFPSDIGLICYNCPQQKSPDACNQIKICSRDDVCLFSFNVVGTDIVYRSECTSKQACQGTLDIGPIFGRRQESNEMISRRKRAPQCRKCCSNNLCNLDNCTSLTHINATSNPSMTTDSVTIAPVFLHSVDGQWSAWTAWGICSQTCGTGGITARQRTCNNPAPSAGGKDCVGGHAETQNCSGSQGPQIIRSAQNFTKPIGSRFVIDCLVLGSTPPEQVPKVYWTAPIIIGQPLQSNVVELRNGSIFIDGLTLANIGAYSCTFNNDCGTHNSANFWVNIQ